MKIFVYLADPLKRYRKAFSQYSFVKLIFLTEDFPDDFEGRGKLFY